MAPICTNASPSLLRLTTLSYPLSFPATSSLHDLGATPSDSAGGFLTLFLAFFASSCVLILSAPPVASSGALRANELGLLLGLTLRGTKNPPVPCSQGNSTTARVTKGKPVALLGRRIPAPATGRGLKSRREPSQLEGC